MNKEEYRELRSKRVIGSFGECNWYSSGIPYDHKEISKLLAKQLTDKIDYKNMVVMFPISSGYGCNYFFSVDNGKPVLIDHSLFFHRICEALEKKNIKFKNKISINDKGRNRLYKYGQMRGGSLLIIQDGIMYMTDNCANPASGNLLFNKGMSYEKSKLNLPLCLNEKDVKKGITPDDKPWIFSGYLLRRISKRLN